MLGPPLPIERGDVAAVTTEQYLIVAGGKYRERRISNRVNILNIDTKIWSEVSSLASGAVVPSTTIIGDQLYVLGGEYSGCLQRYNIMTLIQSKKWTQSVWETLESCPVSNSTCMAQCQRRATGCWWKIEGEYTSATVHRCSA